MVLVVIAVTVGATSSSALEGVDMYVEECVNQYLLGMLRRHENANQYCENKQCHVRHHDLKEQCLDNVLEVYVRGTLMWIVCNAAETSKDKLLSNFKGEEKRLRNHSGC